MSSSPSVEGTVGTSSSSLFCKEQAPDYNWAPDNQQPREVKAQQGKTQHSDSPMIPFLTHPKLQEGYSHPTPFYGAGNACTWAQDSLACTWLLQGSTFCANSRLLSVCS